jgi:hypothetical protein
VRRRAGRRRPIVASSVSLGSSSVSTRLTKNEATEATRDRSPPWAASASSPEMCASTTAS